MGAPKPMTYFKGGQMTEGSKWQAQRGRQRPGAIEASMKEAHWTHHKEEA